MNVCFHFLINLLSTFWRRKWQPTSVLLPGKSHGWRSVLGYSPWGRKESDTTEQLHFLLSTYGLTGPLAEPEQLSDALAHPFMPLSLLKTQN